MRALRRTALTALVCGQASAALAGVLPLALLPVAVGVALGAAALSSRDEHRRALRTAATLLSLGLTLLLLPQVAAASAAEDGLRGVLGTLLVGIATVQPLTWARPRDVQTGVGAAFGLLVLGASFAPDVLVGLPLVAGWVALVAALAHLVRERAQEGVDHVLTAPDGSRALPVATALAAVLGLVVFLLVPLPEDAGVRSRLAQAAAAAGATGGRAAPGAYTGDAVDLRVRGELTDVPVITVPHDSPPLWRSGVYSDWDGTTWRRDDGRRRLGGPPFVLATPSGPTRADDVRVERRARGVVWAPGPVVQLEGTEGPVLVDEHGAVHLLPTPTYRVTSEVVEPTLEQLRTAAGPDATDPRWTAVPAGVPARVRDLGRQLTGDAPTRIDAVRAVERWLAGHARYDLDSPVPAPGEDAVDRFLFVDRVGFCEQFAAAEVLLLRAAGIPARFVTGLAYGVESGDGRRTYRQKDLHAWVEVFHPGIGWVTSNPTPPATQLASAPLRTRIAAQLTAALRQADDVPGGRLGLAAGLLTLTALAGAVGALARRRPQRTGPVPPQGGVPVAGRPALQAFLRFDERLGARRRRPAESLRELQQRLDPPGPVRQALEAVEQECYGAVPPAQVSRVVEVLDRT